MRFLNASVLLRKALNRNLSWGFPLGNLLPKTRVLKHCVLERKRRPNANASVLGTQRFRTLRFWEDFPLCPQCPPPPQNRKFYFYCRLAVSDLPLALQNRAFLRGEKGEKVPREERGVASKAGKKEKGGVKTSQELQFPAPPIENAKPPQRTLPY